MNDPAGRNTDEGDADCDETIAPEILHFSAQELVHAEGPGAE